MMRFLLAILFSLPMLLTAQHLTIEQEGNTEVEVLVRAEQMPYLLQCQNAEQKDHCTRQAISDFLSQETNYPDSARENEIEGMVICRFVVDIDGSIKNPKILRPVHHLLAEEAIRVIMAMPQWIPGEQDGVPVMVAYTIPITFRLE